MLQLHIDCYFFLLLQHILDILDHHAPQYNVLCVDGQLEVAHGEGDQDQGGVGDSLTSKQQHVRVSTRNLIN